MNARERFLKRHHRMGPKQLPDVQNMTLAQLSKLHRLSLLLAGTPQTTSIFNYHDLTLEQLKSLAISRGVKHAGIFWKDHRNTLRHAINIIAALHKIDAGLIGGRQQYLTAFRRRCDNNLNLTGSRPDMMNDECLARCKDADTLVPTRIRLPNATWMPMSDPPPSLPPTAPELAAMPRVSNSSKAIIALGTKHLLGGGCVSRLSKLVPLDMIHDRVYMILNHVPWSLPRCAGLTTCSCKSPSFWRRHVACKCRYCSRN
jgi:hypothetical protein